MRTLSQTELSRMSRAELSVLFHAIVCELPSLREGSADLCCAHANLLNIRRARARTELGPCRPF